MIKDENYIAIQGWMLKLGLSGNRLLVYAIIYGFSQDSNSVFSGTAGYIADWLNTSRRTAMDIMNDLTREGLLIKYEKIVNGVKLCDYKVNQDKIKETFRGSVKNFQGGSEKVSQGGSEKVSHHNIDIENIEENKKKINTVNSVYKEKDPPKRSWGEFGTVKLTEEEFVKIVEKYGWYTEFAVEKLDGYIATHGDPYKRHYPVFKRGNWIWGEAFKNRENGLPPVHNTIIDPSSPTGARAQTALEYYTEKYGLGKQQGKENSDVGEKKDMHIPD